MSSSEQGNASSQLPGGSGSAGGSGNDGPPENNRNSEVRYFECFKKERRWFAPA